MKRLNLAVVQTTQVRPASTRDTTQSATARLSSSILTMTWRMWTSSDLSSCSTEREAGPRSWYSNPVRQMSDRTGENRTGDTALTSFSSSFSSASLSLSSSSSSSSSSPSSCIVLFILYRLQIRFN